MGCQSLTLFEKKIGKSEKTPVANDCIRDFCKVSWGFVAPTENSNLCKLKNKSANAWHWKKPACLTHLSEKDEKDSVNYILALKSCICANSLLSLYHTFAHICIAGGCRYINWVLCLWFQHSSSHVEWRENYFVKLQVLFLVLLEWRIQIDMRVDVGKNTKHNFKNNLLL